MRAIPTAAPPARSKEKILEDLRKRQGKGAKMRRKLEQNRDRNWLLGLTLHSFSKYAANASLSGLEQGIVKAFKDNGFTDGEIKEHGVLYERLTTTEKKELFPGKFATMTKQTKYSEANLETDLPRLEKALLGAPNAIDVDVQAIHAGRASLSDFPMPPMSVVRDRATAILRAVEPNWAPPNPKFTIKATKFRCNTETGVSWWGSDEPYWIFGSLGAGTAVTTRSQIFGDVDSGETRVFGANEGCVWGQNCLPQDLPEGEVGSLVQLWAHDYGDSEKIRAGVAAAFAAAAGILAATGVAVWIAAVVAGVGAVVQWLLGFLDDDHIADQTFVFTRQSLTDQLTKVGRSFNVVRRFTDGEGDYSLTVEVTKTA